MDDYAADAMEAAPTPAAGTPTDAAPQGAQREPDEGEKRLVSRLRARIVADSQARKKTFDEMRLSRQIARRGAPKDWPANAYVANLTGRHINQAVSALYAKNPKATARRRERLDFQLWDESLSSLEVATQTMQGAQAAALGQSQTDPVTGAISPPPMVSPEQQMQAQMLLADVQQGMMQRELMDRTGKTLEILFNHFMTEQKPVDVKTAMKQLVRRAKTCKVGFVELGFQREYSDADSDAMRNLSDVRGQIAHIRVLMEKTTAQEDYSQYEADLRELELSMQALEGQEFIPVREGLVFDFPDSTAVIPDQRCRALIGFVGSRWLTVQYEYSPDEVREIFGYDIGKKFTPYTGKGFSADNSQMRLDLDDQGCEMVCVWKHYDRRAGVVYYLADGHDCFLKPPAAPDVYVEDFWPVYALTFNEVEDPDDCYPPSDVELLWPMQKEWNKARQGKAEHRQAARPRFLAHKGAFEDNEKHALMNLQPFEVGFVNPVGDKFDIASMIGSIPIPGVDPNLYDTGEIMSDVQLTVGAQEAQFGATGDATATETAIAEGSRVSSNDSATDDLDTFLSTVARAAGTILLKEMSEETVKRIAGPGAVWPPMSLEEIASEIYLEIEAGSSGKPNAAAEIANWERMLPFLIQMPTIQPEWLARETLRRLDDRMDLTGAIMENLPAIVSLNRMSQPSPADPGAAPDQQGPAGEGGGAPAAPAGPSGTPAPMGNNRA